MTGAAPPGGRTAVMYVFNPCTHDARVLREAGALAVAGWSVTIAATHEPELARRQTNGRVRILRFPGHSRRPGPLRVLTRYLGLLTWSWRVARAGLRGDVHHAHDLPVLPLAWLAARRQRARLVYDSHELFLDAVRVARLQGWRRRLLAGLERRLIRRADAVVTVNEAIAAELQRRYRLAETPLVVMNCPPRWRPEAGEEPPRPDRLRAALGLAPERRILLYQGGFTAHRGLERIAEALLDPRLAAAVAVYLGYGPLRAELEALAAEPPLRGRLFVLEAVPPEELLEWTAGADVTLIPLERSTLNHWLNSPNKLFESLAAGVPVVASRFPVIEPIVAQCQAGELLEDPTDARELAAAVERILALPPAEYAALRRRCRRAALERYNWETEGARLVALYARLAA